MEEAQFAALARWEDVGQAGLTMPKFNSSLYAYAMQNRFREFYADKVELEHTATSEPEEPQMSDLDLARRVAFMLSTAVKRRQEGQALELETRPVRPQLAPFGARAATLIADAFDVQARWRYLPVPEEQCSRGISAWFCASELTLRTRVFEETGQPAL